MQFIMDNLNVIMGVVIAINAVLARIPKVAENDVFQIFGTIVKNIAGKVVTPVK